MPRVERRTDPPPRRKGSSFEAFRRFRDLDQSRLEREWKRYLGTPQRELFYELRLRFLRRHRRTSGRALEVGPGPGRFSAELGGAQESRVAIELSMEALHRLTNRWSEHKVSLSLPHLVRGDGLRPPFRAASFESVVVLGNVLGFAGEASIDGVHAVGALLRPGGRLLLEIAPGAGEVSRYFRRLPLTVMSRLLEAPVKLLESRVLREGFAPLPPRKRRPGDFRRWRVSEIRGELHNDGFRLVESVAVAPATGGDPRRVHALRGSDRAWNHALELEESLGHHAEIWERAAAVLIALERLQNQRV